ncbi:hypothetical protein H5410_025895 [Solanum commersonii]|uniref:Uncharacterized protein n=1 Tax=Solanum commersonii TaxID=4109 RepID=A0A9J5YUH5_SOLCO|nr:hypothetical protein H5410_025895 [Solanum commersonii]
MSSVEAEEEGKVGSWNIGSLTGKSIELVKILKKRKINIACVQETRWECQGGEQVVEVRRINDRLMMVKLVIGGCTLSVISAYAPNFNGHIGQLLMALMMSTGLWFWGKEWGVIEASIRMQGYPSENLTTQHKLLVMDTEIKRARRKRAHRSARIKWGGLTHPLGRWGYLGGNFRGHKGDWWWNGEVQGKVEGEEALQRVGGMRRRGSGGELKKAKAADFEQLVWQFGDKGGDKKLYAGSQKKERKARDLDQVKCIEDEEGKVLMDEISMARGGYRAFSRMKRGRSGRTMRSRGFWKSGIRRYRMVNGTFNVIFKAAKDAMNGGGIRERVVEMRVRRGVHIWRINLDSNAGRSTTEVIHFITAVEKYRKEERPSHGDKRHMRWSHDFGLEAVGGDFGTFQLRWGARGSVLSPFLFALEEVPWCMLFADDIVLIDEARRVITRLEVWRQALESKGFEVQIGDVVEEADGSETCNLRSFLREKLASEVLCDKKIPSRFKGKFYRVVIRQSLVVWSGVLAIKNAHVQKMHVAKMRMLIWMCGHTRSDKIRNEVIREKVGVAFVVDKLRKARLRWFGHVKRRRQLRGCSGGGRSRPKKYWGEVIRRLGSASLTGT